jgi:hypothetical protein
LRAAFNPGLFVLLEEVGERLVGNVLEVASGISMSTTAPSDTEKFSMMGVYGSEADAKVAMAGMTKYNKKYSS